MDWQILAIWLITGVTLYYFLRSEKQRKHAMLEARARHFATAPAYRHRAAGTVSTPPAYVPMGLSPSDRMFLQSLARTARQKD
ncbi:hypothetical protein [Devosia sp.]|jgi:hypothetical protein|uniref:hypothetical protein n=1 Tax=Devosia sp. TaxID=1871048 RepID=UPI001AC5DC57|nr:hypothetical protein [Devosia sp.]MBN9333193.1 hypothetical protein [Devosia sp.]